MDIANGFIIFLTFAASIEHSIGSNVTQNKTSAKDIGHQEAITFFRTNGSGIDMSAITHPLLTNVTAENIVGVAPVANVSKQVHPWTTLKDFAAYPPQGVAPTVPANKAKRDVIKATGKIEKGAALIPTETGVQSIALPPLLTLNNNMSKIPVPIPNVSVVSYAKVNTLVHTP